MIQGYGSIKYTGSNPSKLPDGAGDLYYEGDRARDFAWLWDRTGALMFDITGAAAVLVSGGIVTDDGSHSHVNVSAGVGYAPFTVSLGYTSALPPATEDEDITAVRVAWGAQSSIGAFAGTATYYVKVQYTETDWATRGRQKAGGTWAFSKQPSFTFAIDTSVPTAYQILLATVAVSAGAITSVTPALIAGDRLTTERYVPTAGYTPAVGDVVELLYTGQIRKASRGSVSVLASGQTLSSLTPCRIAPLDATHAVAVYVNGLVATAVIVTVNLNDRSTTQGTPLTVFTFTTTVGALDVSAVDSTHVLVTYTVTGGSYTQLSVVTLTANTGTGVLTLNTPVNGSASAQQATLYNIPGTSSSVLVWGGSNTTILAAVVTVSGTVPTINTAATDTVTSWANNPIHFGLAVNSAGTVAVVSYCFLASPYNLHFATFTISGASTTFGTDTDSTLTSVSNRETAVEEGGGSFFGCLVQSTGGSPPYITAGYIDIQLAGTGPATTAVRNFGVVSSRTSNDFVIGADKPNGVFLQLLPFRVDGNTTSAFFMRRIGGKNSPIVDFTFSDAFAVTLGNGANGEWGACVLPSSGLAVMVQSISVLNKSILAVIGRRNAILGVAVDTVGTVQRAGIAQGLSGLTPGPIYMDDNGNITSTPAEVKIGVALSSSSAAMAIVPGI